MFCFSPRIQSRTPCCIYSPCLLCLIQSVTVSWSFLAFHNLDSFEVYRSSVWISVIFISWLEWDYRFGEECHSADIYLDHSFKAVSIRFLKYNVTCFPFSYSVCSRQVRKSSPQSKGGEYLS